MNQSIKCEYVVFIPSFSNLGIPGKICSNSAIIARSINIFATSSAPSCSPSYTNSILPVIDGIIDIKSIRRIFVLDDSDSIKRNLAAAIKFSMALMDNLALTPLFRSTNSLSLAAKATCSIRFFANDGILIDVLSCVEILASCCVISLANAIVFG